MIELLLTALLWVGIAIGGFVAMVLFFLVISLAIHVAEAIDRVWWG